MKYIITTGKPEKLPSGKTKGVIDIHDEDGNLANFITYTIGNYPSRVYAKLQAKKWIEKQNS